MTKIHNFINDLDVPDALRTRLTNYVNGTHDARGKETVPANVEYKRDMIFKSRGKRLETAFIMFEPYLSRGKNDLQYKQWCSFVDNVNNWKEPVTADKTEHTSTPKGESKTIGSITKEDLSNMRKVLKANDIKVGPRTSPEKIKAEYDALMELLKGDA